MAADDRIERHLRVSRILFAALLMSIAMYAVIAQFLASQHDARVPIPQPELAIAPLSQPLVLGLGIAALVMLAITPLVRSKLLPPRSHGGRQLEVPAALSRLRAAEIVSWAMTESVAVFGLILSVLSYEPRFTFAAAGVAAVAMVAYAPHRKLVWDVVRAAGG